MIVNSKLQNFECQRFQQKQSQSSPKVFAAYSGTVYRNKFFLGLFYENEVKAIQGLYSTQKKERYPQELLIRERCVFFNDEYCI